MGVGQAPVCLEKREEGDDHHAVDVVEHVEKKKQGKGHTG
jgi:hypothetical protein